MKAMVMALALAAAGSAHTLAPGRMDVYKTEMNESYNYVITVSGDGNADIDCALADPVKEEILIKDESYQDGCTLTFSPPHAGTYLLAVANASEHRTARYTLHSTVMGQHL
jgi:hypothetical protein